MTLEAKDSPDFQNAAYIDMQPGWELWSDVLAGQDKLRSKYLTQEYGEHPDDFKARVEMSLYFEDPRDCMMNLWGMVAHKQPSLREDVPPLLKQYAENIDNAGTHFVVLLQQLFESGFFGHAIIVVERPPQSPNVRTRADEIKSGARTYWCIKQARDAYNWRFANINGQTVLTQITFRECTKESDGRFGEQEVVRYRVYFLAKNEDGELEARWELWRESKDNKGVKAFIDDGSGVIRTTLGVPLKRLPIAVHYGDREGFLQSRPPLKGVADISIADFRKYADLSFIEHKACTVTLAVEGQKPEIPDVQLGGNRVFYTGQTGDTANKAYFLTISGDSIPALERDREMLQKRIIAKGLDFLREDQPAATATEINRSHSDRSSKLAKMVRSLRDAVEYALELTAEFEGLSMPERGDGGGSLSIGVDENALTLTPEQLRVLSDMNEKGQLSLPTLFAIMGRGDLLPEGWNLEKELTQLKAEAAEKAEREAERTERQFNSGQLPTELL